MNKLKRKNKSYDINSEEENKSFDENYFSVCQKQNNTDGKAKKGRAKSNIDLNNNSEMNYSNFEIDDDLVTKNDNNNMCTSQQLNLLEENIEHFKKRLEEKISNFRNETLNDVIELKTQLIKEQKTFILCERQKRDAILHSKGEIIEQLKDNLVRTIQILNSQMVFKEKVTTLVYQDKLKQYQKKLRKFAFKSLLKKYHEKRKVKKKETLLRKHYHNRLKAKGLINIKKYWQDSQLARYIVSKDNEWQNQINAMTQYYNKEMIKLKNELQEAKRITERTLEAKNAIQDNLKKVLMKGVMAIDTAAMNILGNSKDAQEYDEQANKDKQIDQCRTLNPSFHLTSSINESQDENFTTLQPVKDKVLSIAQGNRKMNIISRQLYESEINMEILDTHTEELSSTREKLKRKRQNLLHNLDNSATKNKEFSDRLMNDSDFNEEKERDISCIQKELCKFQHNSQLKDLTFEHNIKNESFFIHEDDQYINGTENNDPLKDMGIKAKASNNMARTEKNVNYLQKKNNILQNKTIIKEHKK